MKETKKKTDQEKLDEIRMLSEKANQLNDVEQLSLFPGLDLHEEDITFDSSILNDTADPERSYKLYYSIRRMMIDNLPKGDENKKLRQYIYDEKNIFLNRGKDIDEKTGLRGSDGKMTYIPNFLEVAFDLTANWVKAGGSPFDLFDSFRKLNIERGYRN